MTIPLKAALPGFIVFWVCVATLVSFLPVYFSAVKTVDDTSMTLADTIATTIHERTVEYFRAPLRLTAQLGDAVMQSAALDRLGFPVTVQGEPVGAWSSHFVAAELDRALNSVTIGVTGYAFAYNTNESVIATTWGATLMNASGDIVNHKIVAFADLAPHRSIGDVADVGGLTNAVQQHNASGAVILKKETGEFYFRMGEIKDEYGLHLYFVVVIPKSDFFDEIEAERTKVIIGVVCAVVAMCVIAVVATRILLSTLERIAFRMALSAQLSDNAPADPLSSITELREMQESYEKMRGELNRIKVFLPSAVTYDAEEEDGTVTMSASILSSLSSSSSLGRSTAGWSARQSKAGVSDARKSTTYEVGTAIAAKLHTGAGLLEKDLTVMVINVRGFHRAMAHAATDDWLPKEHRDLFDAVHTAVTDHKGAIDSFNGDHFVATFNATRPCAQHAKCAALAFCHLQRTISDSFSNVSAGIATGKAMVGNLGNATMQRFCIVGPVYTQAVALEKMTASYNTAVLANPLASREIQLVVYYQYMDVVQLPHAKKAGLIATFTQLREAHEKEWMYEIEESAYADPFADINKAFLCVLEGEAEKARAILEAVDATSSEPLLGLPFVRAKLVSLESNMLRTQLPSTPCPVEPQL